ncbi:MAG: NUDIX hydrolase [Bacillota bacterium]
MYVIRPLKVTVRGKEFQRDVVEHPGSVCVLGLTTEDKILFVRQFRPGMGRESLELPGGRLRAKEAPEEAARREMEAETGYRPKSLQLIARFYPTPGYSSEEVYCFVCQQMAPGQMQFDESEEMQVEFLAYSDALEAVRNGEIVDARSIITLLRWGDQMFGGMKPRTGTL